ncbi:MAG: glycerol-3-phosphate 1-O-acyltransferase PlsY [Gammaproteobacteria bacterium]|nr:glycerol-3-phosphate 1-O-acyltransferase PlsY [Gammaproteobacteria bacterium]
MLELGVKFLISYLVGSLMGALLVGKLLGGVDIRTMGSGNPGGTNALRTQGALFALGVIIIDVGKGAVAAGVVPGLDLPFVAEDPAISRDWLAIACAWAAVFGHVWPVYHGFRGGKGMGTLIGTLIVLAPLLLIGVLAVFASVLVLSGYVGLSTMTAATALPVWLAFTRLPEDQPLFIYLAVMAACIIYWHRSNIQRMREGVENRQVKVMLFKPRVPQSNDEQP